MNNRRSILAGILSVFLLATTVVAPTPAAAAPPTSGALTTAIIAPTSGGGSFAGTLTTTSFTLVNGVINAVGTITGTLTDSAGNVVGVVTRAPVSIPLSGLTGTCSILSLHTGAISLNVLGVQVNLAPIDLTITAQSGPGNLLGNLLCAVAHLLDANGPLSGLVALLNQILGAIQA